MSELIWKVSRYEGIYLRTDGTWAFDGALYSSDYGSIGVSPTGKAFFVGLVGGSIHLYERTGPGSWVSLGTANYFINRGAKFHVVSDDEIWFIGATHGSGHDIVHWTRAGGFVGELLSEVVGDDYRRGAIIVLPTGEVVANRHYGISLRSQLWHRPASGPPWVKTQDVAVSPAVLDSMALHSPDGVEVWASQDLGYVYHSTDKGLTWGPPTGLGDYVLGFASVSANEVYAFHDNGDVSLWNGSFWAIDDTIGFRHRGGIVLGSTPYCDSAFYKAQLHYRSGGTWQTDVVTGATDGDDGRAYGISIAGYFVNPDSTPPTFTDISPSNGSSNISDGESITFSINDDDTGVDINTVEIVITIDGVDYTVFTAGAFQSGWTIDSSYSANVNNGYDFTVVKDDS